MSYHTIDAVFAKQLAMELEHAGYNMLTDLAIGITHNDARAKNVLRGSTCVVVLLRPEYLTSDTCLREIENAELLQCPIIPILRSPIAISDWPVHISLQKIVDFSECDDNRFLYQQSFESLVNSLSSLAETPQIRKRVRRNQDLSYSSNDQSYSQIGAYSQWSMQQQFEIDLNQNDAKRFSQSTLRGETKPVYTNIDKVIEICESFVLVGGAGRGKSTIIRNLVHSKEHEFSPDTPPLPLLINLLDWQPGLTLVELLQMNWHSNSDPVKAAESGEAYLYFKGLDDLGAEGKPLFEAIKNWINSNSPPQKIILTGRENTVFDYHDLNLPIVTIVEPSPKDVERFRDNFFTSYLNVKPVTSENANLAIFYDLAKYPSLGNWVFESGAEQFLQNPDRSLSDLLNILITEKFSAATSNNANLANKVSKIINSLAKLAVVLTDSSPQAVYVTVESAIEIFQEKTLLDCALNTRLIMVDENNRLRFSHFLFQAYFAALGIEYAELITRLQNPTFDDNQSRNAKEWDQGIKIYTQISCDPDEAISSIAKVDPYLALDCIIAGCRVSNQVYLMTIDTILESTAEYGDTRIYLATRLAYIDKESAKAILLEVMRNGEWSVRLRASKLLNEIIVPSFPGLVQAIENLSPETLDQVTIVLSLLGKTALPTLFCLLTHDKKMVRQGAAWALGVINDRASVPILSGYLFDTDDDVAAEVAFALGKIGDHSIVPYLRELTEYNQAHIRQSAIKVFAQVDSGGSDTSKTPHNHNIEFRSEAFDGLGNMRNQELTQHLHGHPSVTRKSGWGDKRVPKIATGIFATLRSGGNIKLVNPFNVFRKDDNLTSAQVVKKRLMEALDDRHTTALIMEAGLHDKKTGTNNGYENVGLSSNHSPTGGSELNQQISRLRSGKWNEREEASKSIREYTKEFHGTENIESTISLLNSLHDNDWVVRWTCIEALAWIGNAIAIPHLIKLLQDPNWKIRVATIRALAEIGDQQVGKAIAETICDANSLVREAAVEAVGHMAYTDAIPALAEATHDTEGFVRLSAVEALGKMNHKSTMQLLLSSLQDENPHVRWAAANALSGVATPETIPYLTKSLEDNDGPYWEQKRICDVVAEILDQISSADSHHMNTTENQRPANQSK